MWVGNFLQAALWSALTLYMLAILLRWVGPWIEFEFRGPWLSWVTRTTDPLIRWMRRILPPMGPFDWAPVAALTCVWLVRVILFAG